MWRMNERCREGKKMKSLCAIYMKFSYSPCRTTELVQCRVWYSDSHLKCPATREITWWVMERSDYVQILRFVGIVVFCWSECRMSGVIVGIEGLRYEIYTVSRPVKLRWLLLGWHNSSGNFVSFYATATDTREKKMSVSRVNGNLTQRMFPRDKWFTKKKHENLKKKAHQDEKLNLISQAGILSLDLRENDRLCSCIRGWIRDWDSFSLLPLNLLATIFNSCDSL